MEIHDIQKFSPAEVNDLFRSELEAKKEDYYLERPKGVFALYDWWRPEDYCGWGVTDNKKLIGMTTLVRLPFVIDQRRSNLYLNSDYFIHSKYRKTLAAGLLLKKLQVDLPQSNAFFEIGIEQTPGFLDQLPRYSERFGNQTIWLKDSELIQFFPSSRSENHEVNYSITNDRQTIASYWIEHLKNLFPYYSKSLEIQNAPGVQLLTVTLGSKQIKALIFNRSEVQKVRWSGIPRLNIEKFQRVHQHKLEPGDELHHLIVGFVSKPFLENEFLLFKSVMNQYCLENKIFSWNLRGVSLPGQSDAILFKRRVCISCIKSEKFELRQSLKDIEDRSILESVFL